MKIELEPKPDDGVADVVARAVTLAGVRLDTIPAAYASTWRRAALGEAAHHSDPVANAVVDYALSPRSTRGATRA